MAQVLYKMAGLKKWESIEAIGKTLDKTSGPAGYEGEGRGGSLPPVTRGGAEFWESWRVRL